MFEITKTTTVGGKHKPGMEVTNQAEGVKVLP